MTLWKTREQALAALRIELKSEGDTLQELFDIVDECVRELQQIDSASVRVTALAVIKARNLALSCYSLSLDGLAQEAGALFRVLIEASEILTYFRLDPQRIEEAIEGRLPSAGIIAKRTDGKLQALREHLNKNASHFSFSPVAIQHLVNWDNGTFKAAQPFSLNVLRNNLHVCLSIFAGVAIEAIVFLSNCQSDPHQDLARRVSLVYDQATRLSRGTLSA